MPGSRMMGDPQKRTPGRYVYSPRLRSAFGDHLSLHIELVGETGNISPNTLTRWFPAMSHTEFDIGVSDELPCWRRQPDQLFSTALKKYVRPATPFRSK